MLTGEVSVVEGNLRSPRKGSLRPLWQVAACLVAVLLGCYVSRAWELNAAEAPAAKPPAPPAAVEEPANAVVPKNVAELRALEKQVEQVSAKVIAAVVAVRVGAAQGSGVLVSEDGIVMTAGHVVGSPGRNVTFVFADGKTAKGKTLGVCRPLDAGLMKITDPGHWPFLPRGKAARQPIGSWCIAVGHPLGYQEGRPPVVRLGRLLISDRALLQTDCTIVAGDSGGPLLDLEGRVIGIHSRIAVSTSMNFHVPTEVFERYWDRLLKGEAWDGVLTGRDNDEVRAVFRPVTGVAASCVARIKCDGRDVALGTIVGPDGWVLTKASQLSGRVTCRLPDGRELEARRTGVDPQFDLAMLKIEAGGLPAIAWSTHPMSVGQWVAAPGSKDGLPLALGVVGVPPRKIPPISGVLGVAVADADGGASVASVLPGTAAEKAGLRVNDLIVEVSGKAVHNQAEMIAAIRQFRPGDSVQIRLRRGKENLQVSATLARSETPGARKSDLQNRSDVGISDRRDDFPRVVQHDAVLHPADCGGPLVDLSGEVIGVNIARAGRAETYAVATETLLPRLYELMSGSRAPKAEPPQAAKQAAHAVPYFQEQREGEPGELPPKNPELKKPKTDAPARATSVAI